MTFDEPAVLYAVRFRGSDEPVAALSVEHMRFLKDPAAEQRESASKVDVFQCRIRSARSSSRALCAWDNAVTHEDRSCSVLARAGVVAIQLRRRPAPLREVTEALARGESMSPLGGSPRGGVGRSPRSMHMMPSIDDVRTSSSFILQHHPTS